MLNYRLYDLRYGFSTMILRMLGYIFSGTCRKPA